MAGLYITAVRYSDDDTPAIEHVRVMYFAEREDGASVLAGEHELSVDEVRGILRAGRVTLRTARKNNKGEWAPGKADVRLYGDHYITTDANDIERDNLGELPEF